MKVIQQGDILFVRREEIPQNTQKVSPENGKYILARGEATGHCHAIPASSKVEVLRDDNGRLYLQINGSSAPVTHQEHKTKIIPAGNWEVRRIKEWDYDQEQARQIWD